MALSQGRVLFSGATTSGEVLPPLDPFANLVAQQHNGVVLAGDEEAAVVEVLTGGVGEQPPSGMTPSRGGIEEVPDRTLGPQSTTALGAITLLAFLNLLGYIQNVLTGTSGRKRRSLELPFVKMSSKNHTSLPPDALGPGPPQVSGGSVTSKASVGFEAPYRALLHDLIAYMRQGEAEKKTQRQERLFWSQYLRRRSAPPQSNEPASAGHRRISLARSGAPRPFRRASASSRGGIGGFLSTMQHRLKVASSVMGFLSNPSPARVRRELTQEVPRPARVRRFTTSMNAWYDDLAGRNYDGTQHTPSGGGGVGLLNRLMIGLGRRILGV